MSGNSNGGGAVAARTPWKRLLQNLALDPATFLLCALVLTAREPGGIRFTWKPALFPLTRAAAKPAVQQLLETVTNLSAP